MLSQNITLLQYYTVFSMGKSAKSQNKINNNLCVYVCMCVCVCVCVLISCFLQYLCYVKFKVMEQLWLYKL